MSYKRPRKSKARRRSRTVDDVVGAVLDGAAAATASPERFAFSVRTLLSDYTAQPDASITPQSLRRLITTLVGLASRDVIQKGAAKAADTLVEHLLDRIER